MNRIVQKWPLYLVTEEELSLGRTTPDVVIKAIQGGVNVVQLRDKQKNTRQRYRLGKTLREITRRHDVELIVNDRVDLALALDADGVHLGQKDLPVQEARQLLGEDAIIGVSAASMAEIAELDEDVVDYIGFGAVFATDSKRVSEDRQAIGLNRLRQVAEGTSLPVLAIGGINTDNIGDVIAAGACGAAVISALTQAGNIEKTASEMIASVQKTRRTINQGG